MKVLDKGVLSLTTDYAWRLGLRPANAVVLIHDPESLDGLIDGCPPGDAKLSIMGEYNLTPQKDPATGRRPVREKVKCAICGRRAHWTGFVCTLPDGRLFLTGGDCAANYFGETFSQIERSHREKIHLIWAHDQLNLVRAASPELISFCKSARKSSNGQIMAGTIYQFSLIPPEILSMFLQAHSEDGRMTIKTEVDGYKNRGLAGILNHKNRYRTEIENYGRLSGSPFVLLSISDSRTPLRRLVEALEEAIQFANATPTTSAKDITKKAVKGVVDAAKHITEAVAQQRSAIDFFSPANLGRIKRWINSLSERGFIESGRVSIGDRKFTWSTQTQEYNTTLPIEFTPLDDRILHEFILDAKNLYAYSATEAA